MNYEGWSMAHKQKDKYFHKIVKVVGVRLSREMFNTEDKIQIVNGEAIFWNMSSMHSMMVHEWILLNDGNMDNCV